VRTIKIAVVVMGVMLVVGFAALIAVITHRLTQPQPPREPAQSSRPFIAPPVDMPAGARIEGTSVGADRIVLNLLLPDGSRQLLVLDLGSGRMLGTIPLRAIP
jgi:hypothetical protein